MGRGGRRLGIVSWGVESGYEKKRRIKLTSAVGGNLIARRRALQAVLRGLVERIHVGDESWLGLGGYVWSVVPETGQCL